MMIALIAMLAVVCGGGYLLTTDAFWGAEEFKGHRQLVVDGIDEGAMG